MLTQIVLVLLAIAVLILAVGLFRQLEWLRKIINALLLRKPVQERDELESLESERWLNTSRTIKSVSHLLKEAMVETATPVKQPRKQPVRKHKRRSK